MLHDKIMVKGYTKVDFDHKCLMYCSDTNKFYTKFHYSEQGSCFFGNSFSILGRLNKKIYVELDSEPKAYIFKGSVMHALNESWSFDKFLRLTHECKVEEHEFIELMLLYMYSKIGFEIMPEMIPYDKFYKEKFRNKPKIIPCDDPNEVRIFSCGRVYVINASELRYTISYKAIATHYVL